MFVDDITLCPMPDAPRCALAHSFSDGIEKCDSGGCALVVCVSRTQIHRDTTPPSILLQHPPDGVQKYGSRGCVLVPVCLGHLYTGTQPHRTHFSTYPVKVCASAHLQDFGDISIPFNLVLRLLPPVRFASFLEMARPAYCFQP